MTNQEEYTIIEPNKKGVRGPIQTHPGTGLARFYGVGEDYFRGVDVVNGLIVGERVTELGLKRRIRAAEDRLARERRR